MIKIVKKGEERSLLFEDIKKGQFVEVVHHKTDTNSIGDILFKAASGKLISLRDGNVWGESLENYIIRPLKNGTLLEISNNENTQG